MHARLSGAGVNAKAGTVVTYTKCLDLRTGIIFSRPTAVGDKLSGAREGTVAVRDVVDAERDTSFTESEADKLPEDAVVLQIQGPFGAPAQMVWNYETVLVVGSGIGVTPFAAILRSIQLRAMQRNALLGRGPNEPPFRASPKQESLEKVRRPMKHYDVSAGSIATKTKEELIEDAMPIPKRVRFVWIVRGQEEVSWFYDLLAAALEGPCKSLIDIDIYQTGTVELGKVKSLNNATRHFSGRPKWGTCFKEMKADHPKGTIGVFLCGSPAIGNDLAENAKLHSDPPNMMFKFYKESF
jgi:hypothetical protein